MRIHRTVRNRLAQAGVPDAAVSTRRFALSPRTERLYCKKGRNDYYYVKTVVEGYEYSGEVVVKTSDLDLSSPIWLTLSECGPAITFDMNFGLADAAPRVIHSCGALCRRARRTRGWSGESRQSAGGATSTRNDPGPTPGSQERHHRPTDQHSSPKTLYKRAWEQIPQGQHEVFDIPMRHGAGIDWSDFHTRADWPTTS